MTYLLLLAGLGLIVLGADRLVDGASSIARRAGVSEFVIGFTLIQMEYNFKKVHTGKDLIISIILIASGAGLFFLNKGLGITVGVCGLVCLLIFKAGYKLNGKGVVLTKKSEDLCKCCRTSVVDFLNGKNTVPEIKRGNEGGIIRLDVYFNKSERVAYVQAFDFCNYTYESVTGVVELEGNKAEMIYTKI